MFVFAIMFAMQMRSFSPEADGFSVQYNKNIDYLLISDDFGVVHRTIGHVPMWARDEEQGTHDEDYSPLLQ